MRCDDSGDCWMSRGALYGGGEARVDAFWYFGGEGKRGREEVKPKMDILFGASPR